MGELLLKITVQARRITVRERKITVQERRKQGKREHEQISSVGNSGCFTSIASYLGAIRGQEVRRYKMKQPKKLTRKQKNAVDTAKLNPDNWMLVEQTEFYLKIIHKTTGKIRRIDRYAILKKGGMI